MLRSADFKAWSGQTQSPRARAGDGGIDALRAAFGLDPGNVAADSLGVAAWQEQSSTWERVETQAVSQSQMLAQAIVQQAEEAAPGTS